MSIYNRSYMRHDYNPGGDSPWAMKLILVTLVAVFFLQNVFRHWFGLHWMEEAFALSLDRLISGYIHTLLTYGLLHSTDPGVPWHLLLNGLMLYLFGRELEFRIGSAKFTEAFLFSVLLGSLVWLTIRITGDPRAMLLGASAGVFGIITLFCLFRWDDEMGLLFLPGRFTGRHLLYVFLGFQVFFFLFTEMPGISGNSTAYSAHLGGMLGGYLYFRHLMPRASLFSRIQGFFAPSRVTEAPKWERKTAAVKASGAGRFTVNVSRKSDVKREVDRILDKINEHGFGSLTTEEKRILDKAKDLL